MASAIEPTAPPAISALIAQSTGAVENVGATALDDVRDELVEVERAEQASDDGSDVPPRTVRRRRRKGTATRARDLKRRNHQKRVAPDLESDTASNGVAPEVAPDGKAPKKAELLEMLERAQSELAAERARHDVNAIGELSATLEVVALVAYGMLADLWGPHWALEEKEAKAYGSTGAVALAPHAEKLTKALPWLAFLATAMQINYKRVKIDQAIKASRGLELAPPSS